LESISAKQLLFCAILAVILTIAYSRYQRQETVPVAIAPAQAMKLFEPSPGVADLLCREIRRETGMDDPICWKFNAAERPPREKR
jgi:hypothetical protein